MIALLLAAQVAAAVQPDVGVPMLVMQPPAPSVAETFVKPRIIYTGRRLSAAACAGPARYQTSNPEPALLLRPQDERAREGAKRLIDMPMGRFCLTGPSTEAGR